MTRVLVLNASMEPINVCTVKRAVVLLLKERAEVIEHGEGELHSETTSFARPAVIRLVAYVRIPHGYRRRVTRKAVFARDDWVCQYCGSETALTLDHVIPRSRGGPTEWENVVAACPPCNRRKNDRLPKEAGMKLRQVPKRPAAAVFVYVEARVPPMTWQQYLVD